MGDRRGERLGWIWGWIGAFLWVAVLGGIFLAQGKPVPGFVMIAAFAVSAFLVRSLAPWRHPDTPMWKLMLPLIGLLTASAAGLFAFLAGAEGMGRNWWSWAWILALMPGVISAGRRRWRDGE